jgi:hypothetical protein
MVSYRNYRLPQKPLFLTCAISSVMERWVGWGILVSNLWHISQASVKRTNKAA